MAPTVGFEPTQTVLETVMLPLHHADMHAVVCSGFDWLILGPITAETCRDRHTILYNEFWQSLEESNPKHLQMATTFKTVCPHGR